MGHFDRQTCGGCGSTRLVNVLDLGSSPLADDFPTIPNAAPQLFPLRLQQCPACTMLQLEHVVDDTVLWGGEYGFYSSASSVAVQHFIDYAKFVHKYFPTPARRGIVEIACNDGTLLAHLGNMGYSVHGIDPAAGPVEHARARGLTVTHAALTWEVAQNHVTWYGHAGLVIANNVIAHVTDLPDFVRSVAHLMDDEGVALIEFQYGPDLLAQNAFDHLYHEHRFFLTLSALQNVLSQYGLIAVSAQHNDMQRGSLRVIIRRGESMWPDHSVRDIRRAEDWLTDPHALRGLQGIADHIRTRFRTLIHDAKNDGLKVAGYGASAKATTLLHWTGVTDTDLIQYVVDTTPHKHGRYMPGTDIPIVAPTADSRRPDLYVLFVSNYLSAILRREQAFIQTGGRILVPAPYPTVI